MKVDRLYDSEDHLSQIGAENGTRVVPAGTILFVVRGMILAKQFPVAMAMREVAFNQDLKAVICKPGIQALFLYYWLRATSYEILGIADEAAHGTKRLQTDRLLALRVSVPPIPAQRKIAAILSAYDDLIENNTRRIAILEEMARALYREWFVEFRLPGHENTRMVNSRNGYIPAQWRVVPFTEVVDVLSGGTPRTSVPEYWDGDIPWATPKDIQDSWYVLDTERKITKLGLSKCNSRLYPPETVFITARGTVGRCVLAAVPMAMSQTSYALIGRDAMPQHFVYLLALSLVDVLKKSATGAVFDTIVVDTFRSQLVTIPPRELQLRFGELVAPMFVLVKNLQRSTEVLRRTRDLLLPRLISGELDVTDLGIAVREAK